jgi:hypothetical protein
MPGAPAHAKPMKRVGRESQLLGQGGAADIREGIEKLLRHQLEV